MKKLVLLSAVLMCAALAKAQLKVGDNPATLNGNSMLEVEATDKGLLMPRLALTATTSPAPLSAHVAGMVIYNTATAGSGASAVSPGFYYDDGAAWQRVVNTASFWSLNGNSGIDPATQFLGTTDATPLPFRSNNTEFMRLDTNGNLGIHTTTPAFPLDVNDSFDLHYSNFHVLATNDVFPQLVPGIRFTGTYVQRAPGDLILDGPIDIGGAQQTVTGFVSTQSRALWTAQDGSIQGTVGNMNTNAGAGIGLDSANANLSVNDGTGSTSANLNVQQDNVQFNVNRNATNRSSNMQLYDSSYSMHISDNATNINFSQNYNNNPSFLHQFEQNLGNGDSNYYALIRDNAWSMYLNNNPLNRNTGLMVTNGSFGIGINDGDLHNSYQMTDSSTQLSTYNSSLLQGTNMSFTNNALTLGMSDTSGHNMNTSMAIQFISMNTGSLNGTYSFYMTDTLGYFSNFNNLTGKPGYFGFATNTPQETVDINGSLRIADNGYGGVNDGDTTPVPTGGAGTIVFTNGHFFGWNGNTWKQLDN